MVGRFERSVACKIAAEIASPHAPPMHRKKFRFAMTTALWDFVQWACNAMRVGWKVKPTPAPMINTMTATMAGWVLSPNSSIKPDPLENRVSL